MLYECSFAFCLGKLLFFSIIVLKQISDIMGKGDRRTRRGKITKGTYGVRRLHKKPKPVVAKKAGSKPKKKAATKK